MEPENSLPCSQWHATDPYPEPDDSSPHPPTPVSVLQLIFYTALKLKITTLVLKVTLKQSLS